MNVWQSVVLGTVQGLTEFIPVSSTAHLILAPEVLGVPRADHTYDTIIQAGTLVSALLFFWRDWLAILAAAGRIIMRGRATKEINERLVVYLVCGSIPAGIAGLALEKFIDKVADPSIFPPAYLIIGTGLIGFGLVMLWVESNSRKSRTLENIRMPDALVIGCAQALALFPGVSRSGSTITAGLFAGFTREAAARFSFLLMTPIMILATGYKLYKVVKHTTPMAPGEVEGMLLATAIACIVGLVAIGFLLNWLRTRTLTFFVVWRIIVGAFCIGLFFMQHGKPVPAAAPTATAGIVLPLSAGR